MRHIPQFNLFGHETHLHLFAHQDGHNIRGIITLTQIFHQRPGLFRKECIRSLGSQRQHINLVPIQLIQGIFQGYHGSLI